MQAGEVQAGKERLRYTETAEDVSLKVGDPEVGYLLPRSNGDLNTPFESSSLCSIHKLEYPGNQTSNQLSVDLTREGSFL